MKNTKKRAIKALQATEIPAIVQVFTGLLETYRPEYHYGTGGTGYYCNFCKVIIDGRREFLDPEKHEGDCMFIRAFLQYDSMHHTGEIEFWRSSFERLEYKKGVISLYHPPIKKDSEPCST